MSREAMTRRYAWSRYSKKLVARIETPRWAGSFTSRDVEGRGVRLVTGCEGSVARGNIVRIFLLVDLADGVIADAKYLAYGQSALIGAAETACELCVGKNYHQASRIGADLIDRHLRDKQDTPAFPAETSPHLNLVVSALEEAASSCTDIPLAETYVTPIAFDSDMLTGDGYPGFAELSKAEKLAVIEKVMHDDIRPYIELDAGGIQVTDLINDREVIVVYEGSCTTCYSATGTTLNSIQQLLRVKVHPDLVVVPDLEASLPAPV